MTRLATRITELKNAKQKGLVTFTMAHDPDAETSLSILHALAANGVDILELGMPFSDPMADGPTIQAAALRALAAGATLTSILTLVRRFREIDTTTPLVLMGYYNPIFHYGTELFCSDALAAGVDGLIIVDLPPEEEAELTPHLNGLDFIRLISPTSNEERIARICKHASGFVYYISVTGVTGTTSAKPTDLATAIGRIRNHTTLPIAAGFGITTPAQAKEASKHADLVVVGSALVQRIHESEGNAVGYAATFVKQLKEAI